LDNKQDNKQEEACPWYINSPEHYNCLWIYIIDKSAPDGSMPELVQSEIAQLLGWSNTKTHFMLKQAMAELIEALTNNKADQLLGKDPDQNIDIRSFDIDPINYTSDDTED
jgi:hypothetical protein